MCNYNHLLSFLFPLLSKLLSFMSLLYLFLSTRFSFLLITLYILHLHVGFMNGLWLEKPSLSQDVIVQCSQVLDKHIWIIARDSQLYCLLSKFRSILLHGLSMLLSKKVSTYLLLFPHIQWDRTMTSWDSWMCLIKSFGLFLLSSLVNNVMANKILEISGRNTLMKSLLTPYHELGGEHFRRTQTPSA